MGWAEKLLAGGIGALGAGSAGLYIYADGRVIEDAQPQKVRARTELFK
jgi:hypothetical protein